MEKVSVFWFRRDLRLDDNAGLYQALSSGRKVLPLFIFDRNILDKLSDRKDRRVTFIYEALARLNRKLNRLGSGIEMQHGTPMEVFERLTERFMVAEVFTNEDYEPYARERDAEVGHFLHGRGIAFRQSTDQIIFHPDAVRKKDGSPFQVYSPYAKAWMAQLPPRLECFPSENFTEGFLQFTPNHLALADIGFEEAGPIFQKPVLDVPLMQHYSQMRNYPALDATSRVSVHLRFGTISVRKLVEFARRHSLKYLREVIWRDFYTMILYHFPHTVSRSFKPAYDGIQWSDDEAAFDKWKKGETGFPLVDAGMRELNATGFMHNRVRMMAASFLIKDLLIDWRWGEAYFAEKLLDYDQAQNIGNWQWCAGSGCDAAPYFRVFNPDLQLQKFDPQRDYVKKWIPELDTSDYPAPMTDHNRARAAALEAYSRALKGE